MMLISRLYDSTIRFRGFSLQPFVHPEPSIPIDGSFEVPFTENQAHHGTMNESTKVEGGQCTYTFCAIAAQNTAQTADWCNVARVTINDIPGLVLLEVFDIYLRYAFEREGWRALVHVCQKWRNIVFGSPHRLHLQLFCTARTPVRKTLDVWPLLPIVVLGSELEKCGGDNIIAALEHTDRIYKLIFDFFVVSILRWEKVLAAMLQPFPALTHLVLYLIFESAPVVPASFLGGYAPQLQTLELQGISFPGLPKLLLSTTHLRSLCLRDIPPSGYISPKAMVTSLSLLTRLENLEIRFMSPQSRPDRRTRRPPPLTRTLLPVLTTLQFQGVSEYLEDLVVQIDTPLLKRLSITFSHQLIFDTPQVTQFIDRTPRLKLKAHAGAEAHLAFSDWQVEVKLPRWELGTKLGFAISCRQLDWQLSSVAQICSSSFPQSLISPVEYLVIKRGLPDLHWQDDVENSQWLEVLQPFTAVKQLYLSREIVSHFAPVLKELVEEGATEVLLPALQILSLGEPLPSGPVKKIIEQFVAARQLASHPIALSVWDSTYCAARSE